MNCLKWEIQILRWHEGELDQEAEARLLRHLESCARCRSSANKFSKIDRFLLESPDVPIPSFLNEKIVSRVIEEMQKSSFHRFIASFAYFRPAVAGLILVLGIGVGGWTGLNLSHSMNTISTSHSYDVLALAGIAGEEPDTSLGFLWTESNGGER